MKVNKKIRRQITTKTGITLHGVELVLGETYNIYWKVDGGRKQIQVKLIQVTQYGYNFLYEEENRCILKSHLYVPTKYREKYAAEEKFFMIPSKIVFNIEEFRKGEV